MNGSKLEQIIRVALSSGRAFFIDHNFQKMKTTPSSGLVPSRRKAHPDKNGQ